MDEIFKQNEIGLKRDNKVRLVNHNKNWSKVFDVESKRILEALEIPFVHKENLRKNYNCS